MWPSKRLSCTAIMSDRCEYVDCGTAIKQSWFGTKKRFCSPKLVAKNSDVCCLQKTRQRIRVHLYREVINVRQFYTVSTSVTYKKKSPFVFSLHCCVFMDLSTIDNDLLCIINILQKLE